MFFSVWHGFDWSEHISARGLQMALLGDLWGARLILRWVTVFLVCHLSMYSATHANSASYPMRNRNAYWPKGSEAQQLDSKGKHGLFRLWKCMCVSGKTV